MGQKVNPISMRVQATKDWTSKWFAGGKKEFAGLASTDINSEIARPSRSALRLVLSLTRSRLNARPIRQLSTFGPLRRV